MKEYLDLLRNIQDNGEVRPDRTGTGTISLFGPQIHIKDIAKRFPLLTTKKIHLRSVFYELIWFLRGETNVKWLQQRGVTIWDEWADENGDLGPVYGKQWVDWTGHFTAGSIVRTNQIERVISDIRTNPASRRILVSAWNVSDLPDMALEPCHVMFQFYVNFVDGKPTKLNLKMYQRSADLFLGVPFNIASYALLLKMIADITGLIAGDVIITFGDAHIYLSHQEQVATQLARTPSEKKPRLMFKRPPTSLESLQEMEFDNVVVEDYDPHPAIKAPIAV